jgi:carbon-monoxide dehydrogenase large subunit
VHADDSPIGQPVPRLEDGRLLTGRGRFVDDLPLPGALYVEFVRAAPAHGALTSVDTSAAADQPGVVTVLTGAELAAHARPLASNLARADWQGSEYHPLAVDRVRFTGQAVAAVVATDPDAAAGAAGLVVVEVDPLEAITDLDQALDPASPPLHPGWRSNLFAEHRIEHGDVDAAFAAAAGVVELELHNHRQVGLPLEPRACAADWADDRLTMWTSSQVPQLVRAGLAHTLGWPEDRIRVISPDVGGGFGVKQQLFPEEVVLAYLARSLRRGVRWRESSTEHLLASVHAREQRHRVEAAYDAGGKVLALRALVDVDAGAYSMFPSGAGLDGEIAALALPGPYDIRHLRIEVRSAATNKCPVGPYRGVGRPAACFSIERIMDRVALELNLDPLVVRARNLIPADRFPYRTATGVCYDSGDYHAVLDALDGAAGYSQARAACAAARRDGRAVGVGVAFFVEQSSFVSAGRFLDRGIPLSFRQELSAVKVHPDGRVEARLPTHSHGQAHETTAAQIVASRLGCAMEAVEVRFGDTALTPLGIGTFNSRSVVSAGGPLLLAADQVRSDALAAAAAMLECDPADLEVGASGVGPKGIPDRALPLGEIAGWLERRGPDEAPARPGAGGASRPFGDEQATGTVASGAHLAVVEVDPEVGTVRVLRYIAVEDCGTVLNPLVVRGQIQGGVAQGIGGALLEEFVYGADGQPLTANLADYVVPGAHDVPEVEVHHVVTPSPLTPHGGKGMAEGATIPVAAVLAAAVDDALRPLGADPVAEVPFTPERVHRLLGGTAS